MNKELYDKTYNIPNNIINYINSVLVSHPTGNGVRRAKYLSKNRMVTYQALEKLKSDFKRIDLNSNEGKIQYALAGGNLMNNFVLTTLNSERAGTKMKADTKLDNSNINHGLHIQPINEENKNEKKKHSIAIIVNGNNKILLLKRAVVEGGWGNGKYGFAGGSIEKDENQEEACRREVKEETGLILGKFIERYMIKRGNNTEYIFVSRYNGSDIDIVLNKEHTAYGWFDLNEIKSLDTVPNLNEYLMLCFKEY